LTKLPAAGAGLPASAVLALLSILAGCLTAADPTPDGAATRVTGTVTYRERIALPANAVVHVELSDVSREDAAAVVISERDLTGAGQVPIPFALPYDAAAIVPGRDYAVRARINVDGRLMFTTETAVRVITGGHPQQIEIVLHPPARPLETP
jgi:putative lipoprotein